jgi:hypothetical protein
MVMFLTTAKASVRFDKLPDAAVSEIGSLYKLTGSRSEIVSKLRDRMQQSTYAELDPMFIAIKDAAHKHGADDAVTVYD